MNKLLQTIITSAALAFTASVQATPPKPATGDINIGGPEIEVGGANVKNNNLNRNTAVSGAKSTSVSGSKSNAVGIGTGGKANASATGGQGGAGGSVQGNVIGGASASNHLTVGGPEIEVGGSTSNAAISGNVLGGGSVNSDITVQGHEIEATGGTVKDSGNSAVVGSGNSSNDIRTEGGSVRGSGNADVNVNASPVTTNTVAPTQSQVNNYRSFVGSNAPNVAAAVDKCLVVAGWSFGLNAMGTDAGSLSIGKNDAKFIEQCAAVDASLKLFVLANGDKQQEALSINLLLKALPNYGPDALKATVEGINKYVEENGDEEPTSVMQVFGAKAFKKKPAAVQPVVVAPAPVVQPTKEIVREFHSHTETITAKEVPGPVRTIVRKVNPDGTPWVAPKKDCDCTPKKQ